MILVLHDDTSLFLRVIILIVTLIMMIDKEFEVRK